jgi:hypothetical protein
MSIRLDPRRAGVLKQLAADAGTRPGELVRIWVEERLDAERRGAPPPGAATDFGATLESLAQRVATLERAIAGSPDAGAVQAAEPEGQEADDATVGHEHDATSDAAAPPDDAAPANEGEPRADAGAAGPESSNGQRAKRRARNAVSAAPVERVALHDEMIAVIAERGPLPAAELAAIITERGRYAPPRSGKPLDALTVSARVSNPTYRGRFTRSGGRIGLADAGSTPGADAESAAES